MKIYVTVFVVKNGENELGSFEMSADKESSTEQGTEEFLNSLKKNKITGIYTWKGNMFEQSDLKNLKVSVQTAYITE